MRWSKKIEQQKVFFDGLKMLLRPTAVYRCHRPTRSGTRTWWCRRPPSLPSTQPTPRPATFLPTTTSIIRCTRCTRCRTHRNRPEIWRRTRYRSRRRRCRTASRRRRSRTRMGRRSGVSSVATSQVGSITDSLLVKVIIWFRSFCLRANKSHFDLIIEAFDY